jgi:N-acetylneuraminic acid mutarotase
MHTRFWASSLLLLFLPTTLLAQPAVFSYQGTLKAERGPANGVFDIVATLYATACGGTPIAIPVTNTAVQVGGGLLNLNLDIGTAFDGSRRWLELSVRTNGSGTFTSLAPRQQLTAAPFALYADTVRASNIVGSISGTQLSPGAAASNLGSSAVIVPAGTLLLSPNPNVTNLAAAGLLRSGSRLDLSWQQRSSVGAPSVRSDAPAVWTGTRLIIWSGSAGSGPLNPYLNTGGLYDPASDSWTATSLSNAPVGRVDATAVWTGSRMLIWGGYNSAGQYGTLLNSGGAYDPASNTWAAISTSNAPSGRNQHSAIWTGSEMLIWGGDPGNTFVSDGGRYNPSTDIWQPISTNGAPSPRGQHSAVWTGSEMVIWGGVYNTSANSIGYRDDALAYNPTTDSWRPLSTSNAPSGRNGQATLWTGTEMLVWGGGNPQLLNSGARYNPGSDTWFPITLTGAPIPRSAPGAVWTGSEMLVWGGSLASGFAASGASYNPATDAWTQISPNGPARGGSSAVWTGEELLLFGGYGGPNNQTVFNDLYSFSPGRIFYLYQKP